MDCLCTVDMSADIQVSVDVSVSLSCQPAIAITPEIEVSVTTESSITAVRDMGASIECVSECSSTLNVDANQAADMDVSVTMTDGVTATYAMTVNMDVTAELSVTNTDKYTGDFSVQDCLQKLYPTTDVSVSGGVFVNEVSGSGDLYQSIDDGVFSGDYLTQGSNGQIVADETTYSQTLITLRVCLITSVSWVMSLLSLNTPACGSEPLVPSRMWNLEFPLPILSMTSCSKTPLATSLYSTITSQ